MADTQHTTTTGPKVRVEPLERLVDAVARAWPIICDGRPEEVAPVRAALAEARAALAEQDHPALSLGREDPGGAEEHDWILVSEEDEDETEFCRACGAQRNRHGALAERATTTGGWPSAIDCDLVALLRDPDAAFAKLPPQVQEEYRAAQESVLVARGFKPAPPQQPVPDTGEQADDLEATLDDMASAIGQAPFIGPNQGREPDEAAYERVKALREREPSTISLSASSDAGETSPSFKVGDKVRLSPAWNEVRGEIAGNFRHGSWPVKLLEDAGEHFAGEVVPVSPFCLTLVPPGEVPGREGDDRG